MAEILSHEPASWTSVTSQDPTKALPSKEITGPIAIKFREACTCTQCVDPGDHQRHFVWADIPSDIAIVDCEVGEDGRYKITWRNDIPGYDGHVSHYTEADVQQLRRRQPRPCATFGQRTKRLWTAANMDMAANTVSYEAYMNDDAALARVLALVARDGLAFIDGIPGDAKSVNRMAERVGPIRGTFYGETWDVKSMPDPTNVAYTSRYLGFHMDMLYVREPPGLQFLHCIENTCAGGESRFADTFSAADRLISEKGQGAFDALEKMKVTYHYRRPGTFTSAVKPIFDTAGHESKPRSNNLSNATHAASINKLHRVYWAPPFTGRAVDGDNDADADVDMGMGAKDPQLVETQLQAAKRFHDILEDPRTFIKHKVPAGTCAVFDNFRVVHAREAFDVNSGNRWLRVAYVDDSDFYSRAVTMQDMMPAEKA